MTYFFAFEVGQLLTESHEYMYLHVCITRLTLFDVICPLERNATYSVHVCNARKHQNRVKIKLSIVIFLSM